MGRLQRGWPFTAHLVFHSSKSLRETVPVGFCIHCITCSRGSGGARRRSRRDQKEEQGAEVEGIRRRSKEQKKEQGIRRSKEQK